MAMAVFRQKYRSKIFSDHGTKVLYLKALKKPDGKNDWKIVGKLRLNDIKD